jgi:lactoylglutathione lyase
MSEVKEFRIALTVRDFDAALRLFRDDLGLKYLDEWSNGGRGVLLQIERATLELFDEAQAAGIDQLEAGERVSGVLRLALQVDSLAQTAALFEGTGAKIRPPVQTPWGEQNQRLQTPEGLQVTLFEAAKEVSG